MFKNFFNKSPIVWDTVLFMGEYSPVTKVEFNKIKQFIKNVPSKYNKTFSDDLEVGILVDQIDTDTENIINYELTLDEKKYINGKIFGLKTFPINMSEIIWLLNTDTLEQEFYEKAEKLSVLLLRYFRKSNILIVINDDITTKDNLEEISHKLSIGDMKIGFMVYNYKENIKTNTFKNIPINKDIIKAVCLLDLERPNAQHLRDFCSKYKLNNELEIVKQIHFLCKNENYILLFKELIPTILINEYEKNSDINYKVIMELLKKMYKDKIV